MTPSIQACDDNTANKGYSFLVHTIESTPLVHSRILECLRLADVQRLSVCCKALKQTTPEQMMLYLENIEVLQCLKRTKCLTDDALFRKLCTSLKEYPDRARILSDTEGGGIEVISEGGKLLDGYRYFAWDSYEPNLRDNSLSDMNISDLKETIGRDHQEAMDIVPEEDSLSENDSENKDDGEEDDEEKEQRKRLRRLECRNKTNSDASSSGCCCPSDDSIDRFFYLDQDQREPYCGYCLDAFPLLKLRFCFQHVKSCDANWHVVELSSDDTDTYESLGIEEDEFLVELYSVQPYGPCYLRFIGKGSRNSRP